MEFDKLEQLMSIPKKGEVGKATKKEFKAEMKKLFEEEGFSGNSEKYLFP